VHQLHPCHSRQEVIGNQQVNPVPSHRKHGFFTRGSFNDLKILVLEGVECGMKEAENVALVIDQQNTVAHG
jgi:hypothetical protein